MRLGLGIGLQFGQRGEASGGILDRYTGAAFAFAPDVLIYSAHSVTDSAVGSATEGLTGQYTVRVRRSSDNAVSSFTYTEVSDGTLTTWVGAGNDGFVEAGFDQGANGNHATQATAANQPKIVDAGSLVVENGKAAIEPDGIDDELQFLLIYPVTIVTVSNADTLTNGILGGPTFYYTVRSNSVVYRSNIFNPHDFLSSKTGQNLTVAIATGGADPRNVTAYKNGQASLDNPLSLNIADVRVLFSRDGGGHTSTKLQSVVLFDSDQSTNRAAIETAINTEYSIY